jgi:DNA-binding SARP family transcriptional activator/streptogramin lyase
MEFRVLGPLEVVDDGRALQLGSGRQLALVAVLLLHANEAVSVDRLVDELWGEAPPSTAAKIVRNSVSLLRRELGDRLVTQAPGYLLRVEHGELDSRRLERAIESGELRELTDALASWRGSPLSQFAYEEFAQTEIARLEELRLTALEAKLQAELERGRHATAVGELQLLLREHPLRERLCGLTMLALYRSGRQADALGAFERTRRALDEELGIVPGPALRELHRKILEQDESLGPPPAAARDVIRSRRLPPSLAAAAALVLAVAAVAGFLVTRDSVGGLGAVPPNHVGVIDPETGAIVAAIPVGLRPGPLAAGNGSVWVGNLQDRSLTRIDVSERSVRGSLALYDRTPTALAVSRDAVWVAHGPRGELTQVEPQFGRLVRTIPVTKPPYGTPTGAVAVSSRYVWAVYGDSTLARIEPGGGHPRTATVAGASPTSVAVTEAAVWVVSSGDATVQRFDPLTFAEGPLRSISVGRRPTAIAYGEGALWVANLEDDTITRVDPATGSTFTIRVGDEPVAVAVGAGGVWVANAGEGSLSAIDPDRNEVVRTIEIDSVPAGIVVAGGVVWVAAQAR